MGSKFLAGLLWLFSIVGAVAQNVPPSNAELLTKENVVDAAKPNAAWFTAEVGLQLAIRDSLRTGELSRASMRLTNLSTLRVNELTTVEILPPEQLSEKPVLDLKAGAVYFFSREKPQELEIETPAATGALRGTEFHCYVAPDGKTSLTVLEGKVELSNRFGRVLVNTGEQGNVEVGRAPTKTAVIEATNIIQWCLYYPGILYVDDLALTAAEKRAIAASLDAYRAGDLLNALKLYPAGRRPVSVAERVYRAALLLSVGQVDKARAELGRFTGGNGREALEQLIAAVKFQTYTRKRPPQSAADWMAESYYRQSRSDLDGALKAAKQATVVAPNFGFAWERVAELEFSFGRTRRALRALNRSIELSPRNAQAFALRGFLLSAQNKINAAREEFERAIALDNALGNAWLGRGLSYIRQGKAERGRQDLQTAATLEPNRSLLRSYLGKAFSNAGYEPKARLELGRAKELDPRDPTPWLYSAIENKLENRINEGVRDLEKSVSLNDNRRVFRSQFLLDQDRGVRSSNLAAIYQADGMEEVSVREATRAVNYDYANSSAHLFLANSYNALRDPRRIILRYETPWFNELLLANLLSPVGGGPLSQYVSQQEYSKLFESNRLGLSTTTDYFSTGEIRETASQFGIFGNFSYSLDTEYQYDNGIRPNNDISRSESYAQMKFQLGPDDSLFFQTKFQVLRTGDVLEHYNQTELVPGTDTFLPDFRFTETQTPALLLMGYHHEWYPGVHTLLLTGRLADHVEQRQTRNDLILARDALNGVTQLFSADFDQNYHLDFEIFTSELQQIFQGDWNTLLIGGRFQFGDFRTTNILDGLPLDVASFFSNPPAQQDILTKFQRASVYVYDIVQPFRWLSLTLGASYDHLLYPRNFREVPVLEGSSSLYQLSPKLGVIANPLPGMTIRSAYARSLGGASFDQSILLEPTQVAGFTQVYRTIIPEHIVGEIAGPEYEIVGLGIEQKFASGTYFGADLEKLTEHLRRRPGAFAFDPTAPFVDGAFIFPSSTQERLDFTEKTLVATLNQLIGNEWSLGARYRVSYAELHRTFPEIPVEVNAAADRIERALLNQLTMFTLYNHPSGFFARAEALWTSQQNDGYGFVGPRMNISAEPGDDFWQFNAFAGYRLPRNFGEISLGFLNVTGEEYQLNPLNLYTTLPRDRTLLVRVRLSF